MSVIMTMWIKADPQRVEQAMTSNPDQTQAILDAAKQHGLIAHRFYGTDNGQTMVIDEWPDPESFQAFFDEKGEQIQGLMQEAQAAGEPGINFWRKLETGDDVGWGA